MHYLLDALSFAIIGFGVWFVVLLTMRFVLYPNMMRMIVESSKREAQEKHGKGLKGFFYFVGLFLEEYWEI